MNPSQSNRVGDPTEGRLASPAVAPSALNRRDGVILVAVLAVTLILRAALACQLQYIPSDGAFYFGVAQRLESGSALQERDPLNVYPLILAGLHRVGFDWFTAAKVWGVLAATLVVLPLFGWVRREFDAATAHWACLLYAVHPKLIEYSPEPLRDSTFWLALALCIYLGRRAVREASPTFFALAGLSWAAAVHTRFEGWFLGVPLAIWTAHAFFRQPGARRALTVGAVVGMAMFPTFVLALNAVTPQRDWRLGNVTQLGLALKWLGLPQLHRPEDEIPQATPHQTLSTDLRVSNEAAPATRRNLTNGAAVFLASKTVKGIGPASGLLALLGLAVAWRRFVEVDQLALAPVALLSLAGMALMLWYCGDTSSRYVLSTTILALPYAACGAQALICWLGAGMERLSSLAPSLKEGLPVPFHTEGIVMASLLVLLIAQGVKSAIAPPHADRRLWAELGRRLGETVGAGASVVSCGPRQVGYYAGAESLDVQPSALAVEVARRRPQAIVVNRSALTAAEWANFDAARIANGWSSPTFAVALGDDEVNVYVRRRVAQPARLEPAPSTTRRF